MDEKNRERSSSEGLTNEEVEQDLKARGIGGREGHTYIGSQDTGEQKIRAFGTAVQQGDGFPPDDGSRDKKEGDAGPGPDHR